MRDQSIAKWNSFERMLLAAGAPYKRLGRRQDAMTLLVKCSDEIVHFPLYFPCDPTTIPGMLQRRKHAVGRQLCVTVPLLIK